MSIDRTAPSSFGRTFGQAAPAAATTAPQDRPKAQWWLNVGYEVDYPVEGGGTEKRLVSLPTGIPLDTQQPIKNNSRNPTYAEFIGARNNLLEELMAKAQTMKPGEVVEVPLMIQLRCVNDEENAPAAPEKNSFVRPIFG